MKTSSAKAKGRRGASEARDKLLSVYPILMDDDIVITSSGDNGEDLKLSPRARSVFPYSIEAKNVERLNIWEAIKQAEGHSDKYVPVVFFRRNRSKMYVVVDADEFLALTRYRYG